MCTVDTLWAWFKMVVAPPATLPITTPTAPAVLAFALLLTSTLLPRSQTRILPATLTGSSNGATPSVAPKHWFRLRLLGETPARPASLARISADDGVLALLDAPLTVL